MQTTSPELPLKTSFYIETIGNGYLVKVATTPNVRDPLGQNQPTLFVATLTEIGEAVQMHVADMVFDQRAIDITRQRGSRDQDAARVRERA
jgi:hypothetical protein